MAKVYVGNIPPKTELRDIEDTFSRFGMIRYVNLKEGFAFIDFDDERDADDCIDAMDNSTFDGNVLRVEISRTSAGERRHFQRGGNRDTKCFNCNQFGHWASECHDKNGRNRCFNCRELGHRAKECTKSFGFARERSHNRYLSPRGRSPSPRGFRRSPSPRHSYGRRTPPSYLRYRGSPSPPPRSNYGYRRMGSYGRSPSPVRSGGGGGYGRRGVGGGYGRSPSPMRGRSPSPHRVHHRRSPSPSPRGRYGSYHSP